MDWNLYVWILTGMMMIVVSPCEYAEYNCMHCLDLVLYCRIIKYPPAHLLICCSTLPVEAMLMDPCFKLK